MITSDNLLSMNSNNEQFKFGETMFEYFDFGAL